ncbi:hypothetical protein GGD63_006953 [Bradyrhizobium sp. cir1]|uniref:hypothetical protein n=1 Tax=Bradyrhizobium sp. cir1 TaxID=1445730 RepID=UPI001606B8C8|nr:hypothetical protein [Bradyrhizobium sp. cir1]MBB4374124.1 hypothetical protein [Bradyrhizobium sp. cir1]
MAKATYSADSASLPPFLLLPEFRPDLVEAMHPRRTEPGFAAAVSAVRNVQFIA